MELFTLQRTNDSKARIVTAARADREAAARHLLAVQCFKLGAAPPPRKPYNRLDPAEIQVLIKIIDIDDHLPEFDAANLTVGVRLNVPTHTVIATVKAIDKDPDALPIEYKIINMTFQSPIKSKSLSNVTDVIELNSTNGELKIVKNLIHYADGTFWLTVRANNSNETDRYTDLSVEVAVVRARELLRLVLPARRVAALAAALAPQLAARRLRLQLHDAPQPDAGPCFQFRKTDTGEALTPKAMKGVLRSLGAELQRVLAAHDVREVAECAGEGAGEARARGAAAALLAVAAALPAAALLALGALCCMHASAKRRLRSALLAREAPAASLAAPGRLYAEPLYST